MLSIDSIYNILNNISYYDMSILGIQPKYEIKQIKNIIYHYNFTQNLLLYLNKDNLIGKKICNIAFLENNNNFNYIPIQFKTKDIYIKYFYTNPKIYNDIPKEYLTNKIIELYKDIITFAENAIKNNELCILAIKYDVNNIVYIKTELITQEIVDIFFQFFDINNTQYNLRTFNLIHKRRIYHYDIRNYNFKFIADNIPLKFINDNILIEIFKNIYYDIETIPIYKLPLYFQYSYVYNKERCLFKTLAFKNIEIKELECCPICNETKKYYTNYTCNIKHIICLECYEKYNYSKCYYRCIDSRINYNSSLIINK